MAGEWPHLPAYQSEADALCATPSDWTAQQIESLFEKLPIGKRFDQKTSSSTGRVPVVDQSAEGYVGFHNETAGVEASHAAPVVTFANHTCEMRVMRRPFSVIQNVFPMIGKQGACDTLFFYYATNGRVHIEEYKGHYPDYRRLWLPLPPLPEQKRIAHILGTLDDKIGMNRRMNATLEAVSRAIFKSWFVDFDPVRQKAAGKQPVGMDAQTAALFPDSFEDSEIGEVPKGWEVGAVGDLYDITMGQSPPGDTYNELGDGLPFFQGRADFSFRYPERRVFCTAPTRFAAPGDTLVSVRAPVGDLNMALERCAIGRGVAAVRHKTGAIGFTYYGMHALSSSFEKFEGGGTVFGSMGKKEFHGIKTAAPSEGAIHAFERVVAPKNQQIENLERQTASVATLRDTLLPKLLSGEVRVPEAEEAVGEVLG